jgi:hypothetical protein
MFIERNDERHYDYTKFIDFKAIKLTEEDSMTPDHEEIDRLMLYQRRSKDNYLKLLVSF